MVIDGGSKNKDIVAELAERYRVKLLMVSAYHLQVNKIIECDYKPIVNTFSKMWAGGFTNWVRNLLTVL